MVLFGFTRNDQIFAGEDVYACIIGDLEINEGRVTVKNMRTKKQFDILIDDFLNEFMDEVCEGGK